MTRFFLALAFVTLAFGIVGPATAQQARWHGDYFPNVTLQDHNGRNVRFYDDLLRGKIVAINFV